MKKTVFSIARGKCTKKWLIDLSDDAVLNAIDFKETSRSSQKNVNGKSSLLDKIIISNY